MDEELKNFLINQANMYLDGMSFREIAKEVEQSHVTVRDNITNKIKDIAPDVYRKVQEKIESNTEKTIKDSDVRNRVLVAYKLLTEENKTIGEIACLLDTTENVIYRDLTTRLGLLHEEYPELVTSVMLEKTKIVLQKHSLNNLTTSVNDVDISVINKMYPSIDKRYRFIACCALTFGIRLQKLSEIFGIEEELLKNNLNTYAANQFDSLCRLFYHGMTRQDVAETRFREYLSKLCKAFENRGKDKEKISELLSVISDKKALEFKKNHQPSQNMTDEEIFVLLKFQIKYLLGPTGMSQLFDIDRNAYSRRVRKLGDKFPELVAYFDDLCAYYNSIYIKNHRAGR